MVASLQTAFDVLASSDYKSCLLKAVDVVLRVSSNNATDLATTAEEYYDRQSSAHKARTLELWKRLTLLANENAATETFLVKLLWPIHLGYAVRSDVLRFRFLDCEITKYAIDFGDVGELLQPCSDTGEQGTSLESLFALTATASGALVFECNHSVDISETSQSLNQELERRMSFPWLLNLPIPRKRLALVDGGFNVILRRGIFEAAKVLNIGFVIVDRQGHWLQDAQSEHFREDFIAVDMQNDNSLPQRIADALRQLSRPVDGITTFTDRYLQATAMAAQALGMATEPPEAFRRSVDKSETATKLPDTSAVITEIYEVRQALGNPQFPLIIKPIRGSGSVGVHIVKDESETMETSQRLLKAGKGPLLLETYASGPEIDINMVILAGRLLFFEINDDFPKSAELDYYDHPPSFVEALNVYPSKLGTNEQDLLKNTLFKKVIGLGFRNGVFHVEARLCGSSYSYTTSSSNLLDLELFDKEGTSSSPSVHLIEVNARAPGYQCNRASAHAYGVDYYALSLLLALRDQLRAQILSIPFTITTEIRYWHAQAFLPALCGGTFTGGDALEAMAMARPDLHKAVVETVSFFKDGEPVADPKNGRHMWLATFLIRSRKSRQHVLEMENAVRTFFRDAIRVIES